MSPLTLPPVAGLLSFRQTRKELIALIQSDLYRYEGQIGWKAFFKTLIRERGFVLTVSYRVARHFYINKHPWLYWPMKLLHRQIQAAFHSELPITCRIGPGLAIYHLYGLIVNVDVMMGRNINLSHQVTLGYKPGGNRSGSPVLLYMSSNSVTEMAVFTIAIFSA